MSQIPLQSTPTPTPTPIPGTPYNISNVPKYLLPPEKKPSGWCTPLIIYLVFVVIGIIMTLFTKGNLTQKFSNLIISVFWAGFWGIIMYELCRHGHEGWAWVILLLPILIWFAILFLILIGVITVLAI
jgi:hypothetical protein